MRRGLLVLLVVAGLSASIAGPGASAAAADPDPALAATAESQSQALPRPVESSGPTSAPVQEPPPGSDAGQALIEEQPNRIDDVAAANDVSVQQVKRILADEAAFVTDDNRIFYIEPEPSPTMDEDPAAPNAAPYADTFKLNSKPGSARTIFLDFDGHTLTGTAWNVDDAGPFAAKAYNPDGTPGFSLSELDDVQKVWQVVAEDYAPFDVNVTTQDPGINKIRRSTAADSEYGTRVVITETTDIEVLGTPAGGVAFFDAFDAIGTEHDEGQPAWAFASQFWSKKALGDVVSHEVGHNLGLEHDGSNLVDGEYYRGHGVWGPIMGTSYEKPVAQWSKGEYSGATNTQDDFAVMASHGVAVRVDDHTNAIATATTLTANSSGTITTGTDQDLFKYVATSTGSWNFRATPDPTAPNLDIKLTLLSAAGTQLAQNNPTVTAVDDATATGLDASITHSVTSGTTYYVRVEPTAHLTPSTGYSTYGSIGAYSLSASSGPTCASQDTREPNDTAATAAVATSGQAIASRVCTGNVDYFGVQVVQGQTVNASLLFTHTQGDLNLSLLDPTGVAVASATSTANNETLNHVATKSGIYIVEVYGQAGAANTYSLTVTSPLCPPDDASENNDTLGTAKALQAGVTLNAISCVGDQDYYSFPVPQDGSITVELTHASRFGSLSIQLLSSTGVVLEEDLNEFDYDELFIQNTNFDASDVRRIRVIPGAANTLYSLVVQSAPGAPTGVTAVPGPGSATVNWTDPVDNGGKPILSYQVVAYADGAEVGWEYLSTKPIVVSHLSPGVSHTFKVRAVNAIGSSPPSAASAATVPLAPLVPGAPTQPTAFVGDGAATVSWAPPASDGGAYVTGYVVTPYIGAVAQTPRVFDDSSPQQLVTGLTNGTSYTFKVAAKNVAGTGAQSGASNAVTPIPVPTAPTGVAAAAGYQSATVTWTAPPASGAAPITGYVLTSFVGGVQYGQWDLDQTSTSATVDLWETQAYTFKVAAKNAAGAGAQSAASNAVTPTNTPTAPGAPTNVTASPGTGQVELSWWPARENGSPITGYVVTPYIGASAQTARTFNSADTFQSITGLTNGTTYTFKVAAKNAIGTSGLSVASNAAKPAAPPGAPTGVTAVAGNAKATVSWSAPASNGGSAITGYTVTAYANGLSDGGTYFNSTATSQMIMGLVNGTSYTFKVSAFNDIGGGFESTASNAVTPSAGATVPGAPTGATAVAGNAQVTVSWSAPGSNGGSAITGYVVTPYIGAAAQTAVTFNSTATSQAVTGLTNGTAYTFKVAAKNAVGTGAQSAASAAVTPSSAVVPYAPFASWSAFVTRQYVDLTTKAPTASQLSSWVSQLTSGAKTKGDLDDALRRGSENLANVDPVVRVYRAFLGRAPDAGGLQFWIRRKRNVAPAKTWTVTQIATEFTNSNEFKTKYGSLTNRQFVTQIYTDVLGRAADPSGVNYWTGKLDRKEKTKAQVVVGFSESSEYKRKQLENTDASVAYIYLMGRAPTTVEASDWVTRQKAGTTHAALLTELLNSTKYATRITG